MAETTSDSKGLAIASLVLGIIGIIGCWIPVLNLFNGIFAFIGLILGIIAIVKKQGGMAIAGLVTSIISLVIVIFISVIIGGIALLGAGVGKQMVDNFNTEGIEVTNFQLEATGSPALVTGTLVNHSGNEIILPTVAFSVYDANGQIMEDQGCGAAAPTNVKDGESWDFVAKCPEGVIPARVELAGTTFAGTRDEFDIDLDDLTSVK